MRVNFYIGSDRYHYVIELLLYLHYRLLHFPTILGFVFMDNTIFGTWMDLENFIFLHNGHLKGVMIFFSLLLP